MLQSTDADAGANGREKTRTPPPADARDQLLRGRLADAHVTPSGAVKRRRRSPTPDSDSEAAPRPTASLAVPTPVKPGGRLIASPMARLHGGVRLEAALLDAALQSPSKMPLAARAAATAAARAASEAAAAAAPAAGAGFRDIAESFDDCGVAETTAPVYEPAPTGGAVLLPAGTIPAAPGAGVFGRLVMLGHREVRPFLVCKADGRQQHREVQVDRNAVFVLRRQVVPNGYRLQDATPATYNADARNVSPDAETQTIRIAGAGRLEHCYTFKRDFSTRIFQFGRAQEGNDFCVLGRNNETTIVEMENSSAATLVAEHLREPGWNASSRYAFRVVHDERDSAAVCRVFAAGFDTSHDVFFGERALHVATGARVDGLTTYGLYLFKPSLGRWVEVSAVHGDCFEPRRTRIEPGVRLATDASNVLEDRSLLWNAKWVIMWRSAPAPPLPDLAAYRAAVRAAVVLSDGDTDSAAASGAIRAPKRVQGETNAAALDATKTVVDVPHVFIECGHVVRCPRVARADASASASEQRRQCPECHRDQSLVPLVLYPFPDVLEGPPSHAFVPCGHAIDAAGARRWTEVRFPKEVEMLEDYEEWNVNARFRRLCPFCAGCFRTAVPLRVITGGSGVLELAVGDVRDSGVPAQESSATLVDGAPSLVDVDLGGPGKPERASTTISDMFSVR